MPEVIHRDVGGLTFPMGPWKVTAMLADVDGLRFGTGCGGSFETTFGKLDRGKGCLASRFGHRGNQVSGYGSAVAGVGQHHGFLHRPGVVAAHEADEAVVAVFTANGMSRINGLGFDEQPFEFGKNWARFRFVVAEFEEKVWCPGQARVVVVGALALTNDSLELSFVKARYFSTLAQIILNRASESGGYLVFGGGSEVVFLFTQ